MYIDVNILNVKIYLLVVLCLIASCKRKGENDIYIEEKIKDRNSTISFDEEYVNSKNFNRDSFDKFIEGVP